MTDPADARTSPPVPYRFGPVTPVAAVRAAHAGLPPGTETTETVTVAGRLMLRRAQGRLTFGTLADAGGRIQLFAREASTPRYRDLQKVALGDWLGVTGRVMTTRRGELSVAVDDWVVLARSRRPFPDKWKGIVDPDTRSRQRYVDLWMNDDARRTFATRSTAAAAIRAFLADRGFVEVETPVLHPLPGGATARPFVTHHNALDMDMYLRIAPELYLKRLVVAGYERVFELGRVFRNEGVGYRWNPEFTMLEAYQAYADYTDMMTLTEDLIAGVAVATTGGTRVRWRGVDLDLAPPWPRMTMTDLVSERLGEPVDVGMGVGPLSRIAEAHGIPVPPGAGPGRILLEIYEKTTEPHLVGPVFVCDYPTEVSPLARAHRSRPGYVERFELIVAGQELANAFSELTDPDEQRRRFEEQARLRAAGDEEAMVVDEDYLRALEYGLPPTGGLGIGFDRLVMVLAGVDNIRDVILFPTLRAEVHGAGGSEAGVDPA